MKRGRTIYISVKSRPHVVKWLEKNCKACTGPYPSITGMRNLYWGRDALIAKAGAYIYLLGRDVGQELPF